MLAPLQMEGPFNQVLMMETALEAPSFRSLTAHQRPYSPMEYEPEFYQLVPSSSFVILFIYPPNTYTITIMPSTAQERGLRVNKIHRHLALQMVIKLVMGSGLPHTTPAPPPAGS